MRMNAHKLKVAWANFCSNFTIFRRVLEFLTSCWHICRPHRLHLCHHRSSRISCWLVMSSVSARVTSNPDRLISLSKWFFFKKSRLELFVEETNRWQHAAHSEENKSSSTKKKSLMIQRVINSSYSTQCLEMMAPTRMNSLCCFEMVTKKDSLNISPPVLPRYHSDRR